MISACRSEWNSHSFLCVWNLHMSLKINQLAKGKNHRTSLGTRKLTLLDIKREQTNLSRSTAVVGTPGCWLPRVLWSRHLLHHKQVQASKDVHFRKCYWKSEIIFQQCQLDPKEHCHGRRWAHVAGWCEALGAKSWAARLDLCTRENPAFCSASLSCSNNFSFW